MKIAVIYHRADYDGIFSHQAAKHWLTKQDYDSIDFIGWDFGDPPITGKYDTVYVLDLPCDQPFGFKFDRGTVSSMVADKNVHGYKLGGLECKDLIWIDHHKSSIQSHPSDIPGYRIDGVAACRLTWQWFSWEADKGKDSFGTPYELPKLEHFVNRIVGEPAAIRLAGEYDIWDKRDPKAELFQYGLDTEIDHNEKMFEWLIRDQTCTYTDQIVAQGKCAATCINKRDADMMKGRSFTTLFEGMKFLCLNIAKCNSLTFASLDKPETGHDALMGFFWNGKRWTVSLYHAKHNTGIDLSEIAKKYGGGGHRGACGFTFPDPLFINALTLCS